MHGIQHLWRRKACVWCHGSIQQIIADSFDHSPYKPEPRSTTTGTRAIVYWHAVMMCAFSVVKHD